MFKPGDVVELKSGGPAMTVESIDGDRAYCSWFDQKKEPQSRYFPMVALQMHQPGSGWGIG